MVNVVVRSSGSGRFRSDESGVKYNVDSLIICFILMWLMWEGGGVFGVLYMLVRNGEVLFC